MESTLCGLEGKLNYKNMIIIMFYFYFFKLETTPDGSLKQIMISDIFGQIDVEIIQNMFSQIIFQGFKGFSVCACNCVEAWWETYSIIAV